MMGSMACVGEATLVELVRGGLAEDEGRAVRLVDADGIHRFRKA